MLKTFKGGHTSGIYQATKKRAWAEGIPMDIPKTTDNLVGLLCMFGQHKLCKPITEDGKCTCDCHESIKKAGENK